MIGNRDKGIGISEPREWIIQRCTQKWIGTSLIYEDFPTPEGLMTRTEMLDVLERVDRAHPVDEYRGHNVVQHAWWRARQSFVDPSGPPLGHMEMWRRELIDEAIQEFVWDFRWHLCAEAVAR